MPGEGVAPSIVVRFFWKNVLGNPLIPYIRKIRYFAAQTKYCRGAWNVSGKKEGKAQIWREDVISAGDKWGLSGRK
jgi:hypothetical protein